MKRKYDGGFSLVEVLAAVTIMSLVTTLVCTSIVRSAQIDERSDAMLKARIAVSSAVEQLRAVGITASSPTYDIVESTDANDQLQQADGSRDLYPGVTISTQAGKVVADKVLYYIVEVSDDAKLVTATTCIRSADAVRGGGG